MNDIFSGLFVTVIGGLLVLLIWEFWKRRGYLDNWLNVSSSKKPSVTKYEPHTETQSPQSNFWATHSEGIEGCSNTFTVLFYLGAAYNIGVKMLADHGSVILAWAGGLTMAGIAYLIQMGVFALIGLEKEGRVVSCASTAALIFSWLLGFLFLIGIAIVA